MKITAHVLVKNEDRFLWYSVMSVIDYVDRLLLWDTGSSDKTVAIIDELINDPRTKGKIAPKYFRDDSFFDEQDLRQQMLDATYGDWFIVIDGDEIWWQSSMALVVNTIKQVGSSIESIVVPTINMVGDMFHRQEERAGHYKLAGRIGHYNLRAINLNIPGLHSTKPHGLWGWADLDGRMIQDRNPEKVIFLDAPYLHASFLQRSSLTGKSTKVYKRAFKYKHEIGDQLVSDFFYPEAFFLIRPRMAPFVFGSMPINFKLRAMIETPLRKIKRRLLSSKVGY